MIFKRLSFYLALAGFVSIVLMIQRLRHEEPPPPPVAQPTRSPYTNAVAATGIVESTRENVKIAVPKAGLIKQTLVEVGSKVNKGDPLLQLDDREAQARLATAKAEVNVLKANLEAEKVNLADLTDRLERTEKLAKQNVTSEEELVRRQFAVEQSKARIDALKANIAAAEDQVRQVETELDLLTVRAPRDGTILQVNVRGGEFANLQPQEPLMILGDVETLQIRCDVDEQNAPLVYPNQPAVAYLKGDTKNPIPLQFVRIEPFVVPKRSLTGDSAERVDTRVLQIIFRMDRPSVPIYVGQQVDVYIKVPAEARRGNS